MNRRFSGLGTSARLAIALAVASVAGCGDGDSTPLDPAEFGDETADERDTLIGVARGDVVAIAVFFAIIAEANAEEAGCPARSVSGPTITLTGGGCVDDQGVTLRGTIRLTNVQLDLFGEDRPDPSAESIVEFDDFRMNARNADSRFDGVVRFAPRAANGAEAAEADFSLAVTGADPMSGQLLANSLAISAGYDCTGGDDSVCTYRSDATAEVGGIGSFELAGTFGNGGLVTLRGQNTMTIDLEEDENGCVSVRIDSGTPQPVCPAGS